MKGTAAGRSGSGPRAVVVRDRGFWGAVLVGAAGMAAIDEIVFHQILRWHHFYDASTPDVAILSDGLLHAAELVGLVAGFTLMLDARRRATLRPAFIWAGCLIGAGTFQLWDGLVDHKLLRLHQIRYDVDLLPYDLAWNASAAVLLLAGVLVLALRRGAPAGRARAG